MPTFERSQRFRAAYRRLPAEQKALVKRMLRGLIEDLRRWEAGGMVGRPQFRAELRVKNVVGSGGTWEISWGWPDGRATFLYGPPIQPGKCHIVWSNIGTHRILQNTP